MREGSPHRHILLRPKAGLGYNPTSRTGVAAQSQAERKYGQPDVITIITDGIAKLLTGLAEGIPVR